MMTSVMLLSRGNQKNDYHGHSQFHTSYKAGKSHSNGSRNNNNNAEIPEYIIDKTNRTTYLKGKFLGKGGFARCFEMTDLTTNVVYAGKIIPKSRLIKPHQKEKIAREVDLHSKLDHVHIVKFHHYFEDDDNVYIILENCTRKSLVHVLKHRKSLTEPEVRYYVSQLVAGVRQIHSQGIIHRDLKLGNMLLNEQMQIKIGDFGLATRIDANCDRKITICGTPNYIAPEVLNKQGHDYHSDIWAVGCIVYALLVGRPPFETATLRDTYARISANKFSLPNHLSPAARSLIIRLLNPEPSLRPSLDAVMQHEFFTNGFLPKGLSVQCCTSMPKFTSVPLSNENKHPSNKESKNTQKIETRRPRSSSILKVSGKASNKLKSVRDLSPAITNVLRQTVNNVIRADSHDREKERLAVPEPSKNHSLSLTKDSKCSSSQSSKRCSTAEHSAPNASEMHVMLSTCLENMPAEMQHEALPKVTGSYSSSILWITKWVDYSNKYGFGFQLSNKSVGVLFNDGARISLAPNRTMVYHKDVSGVCKSYLTSNTPNHLQKQTVLVQYFAHYMDENLIQGGDTDVLTENTKQDLLACPHIIRWFRTSEAIIMYLTNGTLQINFFEDHTKVILACHNDNYVVSFIDETRHTNTYRLVQLAHYGCSPLLRERLEYALVVLKNLGDEEGATL